MRTPTEHLTVAQAMTHGALPYVDIWDRKPLGIFLLYLPAALWELPASIYVYQAMASAAAVGTAWLVIVAAEITASNLPCATSRKIVSNEVSWNSGVRPIFSPIASISSMSKPV